MEAVTLLTIGLGALTGATNSVDFARATYRDAWMRHPVYGDPSFDPFERLPGNPILRGAPPFE